MAVEYIGNKTSEGASFGRSSTDLISFLGATPVVRQTLTAITDGSTGTAAATNGIAPATGTYNSNIANNAIATLADGIARIRAVLTTFGLVG